MISKKITIVSLASRHHLISWSSWPHCIDSIESDLAVKKRRQNVLFYIIGGVALFSHIASLRKSNQTKRKENYVSWRLSLCLVLHHPGDFQYNTETKWLQSKISIVFLLSSDQVGHIVSHHGVNRRRQKVLFFMISGIVLFSDIASLRKSNQTKGNENYVSWRLVLEFWIYLWRREEVKPKVLFIYSVINETTYAQVSGDKFLKVIFQVCWSLIKQRRTTNIANIS